MFTPIKSTGIGVLNDTILNTPQPQATSTVQRKSTLESKYCSGNSSQEKQEKPVLYENQSDDTDDSSLGILDNMSAFTNLNIEDEEQKVNFTNVNKELECARKILQKCSGIKNSSVTIDMNKENNANVQNITGILPVSSFALSNKTCTLDKDQKCNVDYLKKANMTKVTFEPNETSTRSSTVNSIGGEQSLLNMPSGGINISSITDELIAQLNKELDNEEFLSSSQVADQISIDEARWLQDNTYAMPVMNIDKQELNCSSFSGIFEPVNLSIASCIGKKVSVGQYFKRKCNLGMLEDNDRLKPNFDVTSKTPMRRGNLRPVIDSTDATMSLELKEKKEQAYIPTTVDVGENSILSLSTIANTLQDVNSETPRRLVDQLLMAQKKKKYLVTEENTRKEIYTLPLDRKSILAASTTNPNKFDNDNSRVNLTTKLSLDSKTTNEVDKIARTLSFASSKNIKVTESFESACELLKENINDRTATFSSNKDADFKFPLQRSALSRPSNDKLNVFSCVPPTMDIKNYDEESYNDLNIQEIDKKEAIKVEVSNNIIDTFFKEKTKTETQFNSNNDVIIGKNTEQLCNCIIGMTCKANIELVNRGSRWITCTLKLSEVQGDQQSIVLNIPEDAILIKPNGVQFAKIEVKVTKMCKPIIAVLNIIISDMVAKSKWFITHMICFKPEELEFDIVCNSQDKQELNFQHITENTAKILPIIFHNKNNINVPVKLSILHEGLKIFSIDGTFSGPVKLNESRDELTHLVLKPQEKFAANIKCERSQSMSVDCSQKQPQYWKSKLIVCVQCGDGATLLLKEVSLCAQPGTCKIQIVDTDVPVVVSKQHGKLLHIVNSGNVTTHVSATIVPMEGYHRAAQEFFIKPDDISLQPGERGSFLITYKPQIPDTRDTIEERHAKIKLVTGNNVYYYIVSTEPSEVENENYARCDTPCNLVSTSSPTSPQSVISSRSGTYQDRKSPSSVVSSAIVAGSAIPIRATHAALVWNSVKTSKSEIKEFTIRNTSNNKIKIQIDIWDDSKSFKFLGTDRQTKNTSMVLAMQRTESKTLAVVFNPYRVGPVTGKITIKHYVATKEDLESQYKRIPLYGYGGCGKMKISDTFKDASGKLWLALGTLSSGTTAMETNFRLQNTGDLCTFAKIKVIPKVISSTVDSSWCVNPTELILNPKEAHQVSIKFYPKKEDFAILQRCVADVSHIVATINIVSGDEPTRWRIRRLYNKIKDSGELARNGNETFKNVVRPICRIFPGEQLIVGLTSIRDPIQSLNDLCTGVQQNEINLIVESCADDTLPILQDNDDESQLYYSLISDNSLTDEVGGASFFSPHTAEEYEAPHCDIQEDNFIVNPPTVTLNPPVCNEATVTIFSFFKAAQPFQSNLLNSNYLSVVPAEGMLPSRGLFTLKIQCSQRIERNMQDVLEIYTENHKQDVLIKVNVKPR